MGILDDFLRKVQRDNKFRALSDFYVAQVVLKKYRLNNVSLLNAELFIFVFFYILFCFKSGSKTVLFNYKNK